VSATWLNALSLEDDEDKVEEGSIKASTGATGSGKDKRASHGVSAKAKAKGDKLEWVGSTPN